MMKNKFGLITGVANDHSIAYATAKKVREQGGNFVITYQNEKLKKRAEPLAAELGVDAIECDLTNQEAIRSLVDMLGTKFGKLDFLMHSVAFARKEELQGRFLDTSKEVFLESLDVSVYTLLSLVREAEPLLIKSESASVVTMTYLGAERVVPNYNMMGVSKAALEAAVKYLAVDLGKNNIRVNAVSAGPIKTLAALGIRDLRDMIKLVEEKAPLKRGLTHEDIANACTYMFSNFSSGVTGEIHYVDLGFNILGM